jgi:hypothetical protein
LWYFGGTGDVGTGGRSRSSLGGHEVGHRVAHARRHAGEQLVEHEVARVPVEGDQREQDVPVLDEHLATGAYQRSHVRQGRGLVLRRRQDPQREEGVEGRRLHDRGVARPVLDVPEADPPGIASRRGHRLLGDRDHLGVAVESGHLEARAQEDVDRGAVAHAHLDEAAEPPIGAGVHEVLEGERVGGIRAGGGHGVLSQDR